MPWWYLVSEMLIYRLFFPSLARSVPKPLKVPSLARSVPKPLLIELREAGGHQPGRYEPLLIFAADLLPSWLSVANAVRLPHVNCESEVK